MFGELLLAGGECCVPKGANAPKEPESRLAKLFLLFRVVTEDLLETVDCDQRFRFPTTSAVPPILLDLLCPTPALRRFSGDDGRRVELILPDFAALGLCDLTVDPAGRVPVRLEDVAGRCGATAEGETALGLRLCRFETEGLASNEAIALQPPCLPAYSCIKKTSL